MITLAKAVLAAVLMLGGPIRQHPADALILAQSIDGAAQRATCSGEWSKAAPDMCRRMWRGSRIELDALLVTIADHESSLEPRIQAGHCRRFECDHGQALSYWQFHDHAWIDPRLWDEAHGLSVVAVEDSAWIAAVALSRARGYCAWATSYPWLSATISHYATGNECSWDGADGRVTAYRRVYRRILIAERSGSNGAS